MIRRDAGDEWLLISQVEHAHLAGRVAAAWGNERTPPLPVADQLVPAVRDHDGGWRSWERRLRLDPATGRPRDFTEMPMDESTQIWRRSVEACARGEVSAAEAIRRFRWYLASSGQRLTQEREAVLYRLLQFRGSFELDELFDHLKRERDADSPKPTEFKRRLQRISRATVMRTLQQLVRAGIVRSMESPNLPSARPSTWLKPIPVEPGFDQCYEVALEPMCELPLEGLWVSRHFCYLAEQTRNSREDEGDLNAIRVFLAHQQKRQRQWRKAACEMFTLEELERVVESGFRWLQFFDRLSLWLCCAPRSAPLETATPDGRLVVFTPRDDGAVVVEPYPLSADKLVLSVPSRCIPARRYRDEHDLDAVLHTARTPILTWTLSPA